VMVQVTRQVDMAGDGFVSVVDVGVVFSDYGFSIGSPNYDPQADLVAGGTVSVIDASIVDSLYGSPSFT